MNIPVNYKNIINVHNKNKFRAFIKYIKKKKEFLTTTLKDLTNKQLKKYLFFFVQHLLTLDVFYNTLQLKTKTVPFKN